MEERLHECGYDVFTIPRVHNSEQRRILEGQRVRGELEREQRERSQAASGTSTGGMGGQGFAADRQRIKSQAKQNAIEEYKRDRGLV